IRNEKGDQAVPIPTDADPRVVPIRRINFHSGRARAFALQLARVLPLDPGGGPQDPGEILALYGRDALVSLLPKRLAKGREASPENRVLIAPKRAEAMRALCIHGELPDGSESGVAAPHLKRVFDAVVARGK